MSLIYDSEVLSAIFSNNNHRFPVKIAVQGFLKWFQFCVANPMIQMKGFTY